MFLSENVDTPTKVSQNNNDLIYDLYDSQASTDETYIPKNEDRFLDMEQRSDMLHNFFLKEISDLKFLREEQCCNKDKIINILLENLLEREITNVSCENSSVKILQSKKSETEFRNLKRTLKINNVGNNSNRELIKTFNRLDQEYSWFDCLSEDESLNDILEANDSNSKSGKSYTQEKDKYNSIFNRRKGNQRIGHSKKSECSR